ncbi:unnamed protein product [Phaeothamnion confervicola]
MSEPGRGGQLPSLCSPGATLPRPWSPRRHHAARPTGARPRRSARASHLRHGDRRKAFNVRHLPDAAPSIPACQPPGPGRHDDGVLLDRIFGAEQGTADAACTDAVENFTKDLDALPVPDTCWVSWIVRELRPARNAVAAYRQRVDQERAAEHAVEVERHQRQERLTPSRQPDATTAADAFNYTLHHQPQLFFDALCAVSRTNEDRLDNRSAPRAPWPAAAMAVMVAVQPAAQPVFQGVPPTAAMAVQPKALSVAVNCRSDGREDGLPVQAVHFAPPLRPAACLLSLRCRGAFRVTFKGWGLAKTAKRRAASWRGTAGGTATYAWLQGQLVPEQRHRAPDRPHRRQGGPAGVLQRRRAQGRRPANFADNWPVVAQETRRLHDEGGPCGLHAAAARGRRCRAGRRRPGRQGRAVRPRLPVPARRQTRLRRKRQRRGLDFERQRVLQGGRRRPQSEARLEAFQSSAAAARAAATVGRAVVRLSATCTRTVRLEPYLRALADVYPMLQRELCTRSCRKTR